VLCAHLVRDARPRQPYELGERHVRPARASRECGNLQSCHVVMSELATEAEVSQPRASDVIQWRQLSSAGDERTYSCRTGSSCILQSSLMMIVGPSACKSCMRCNFAICRMVVPVGPKSILASSPMSASLIGHLGSSAFRRGLAH